MNIEPSTDQQEIKDQAAMFADRQVAPHAAEMDQRIVISRAILKELEPGGVMERYGLS